MAKKAKAKRGRKPKPTQKSSFVGSKKEKIERPDKRKLRSIYRLIINASPEARINALITAVHWYDAAVVWIKENDKKKSKIETLSKLKLMDAIEKTRNITQTAANNNKREELLKKIITDYEKLFSGVIKTKRIVSVYRKFHRVENRLKKRSVKIEARYKLLTDTLEESLGLKNVEGESVQLKVGDTKKDRTTFDYKTLIYSKEQAQSMMKLLKEQGLLPLAINEISWLARIVSYKPTESGEAKYDLHKDREAIFSMLRNLITYCKSNPKIVRKLVRAKRRSRRRHH